MPRFSRCGKPRLRMTRETPHSAAPLLSFYIINVIQSEAKESHELKNAYSKKEPNIFGSFL